MGFENLTIIMFLLVVIVILAVVLAKERTQYFVATRMLKSNELKAYILRDDEVCEYKFALHNDGGVVWITNQRLIHRHSHQFSLLFFAELENIQKIERDGKTLVLTMDTGRKQKIQLFDENVERVFNIIAKKVMM